MSKFISISRIATRNILDNGRTTRIVSAGIVRNDRELFHRIIQEMFITENISRLRRNVGVAAALIVKGFSALQAHLTGILLRS